MHRISLWLAGTAATVVLVFTYRTSTMGPVRPVPAATAPDSDTPGVAAPSAPQHADTTTDPGAPSQGPDATAAPPAPSPGTVTRSGAVLVVNGPAVGTIWGPVQVQVRIDNATITDVTVLQAPGGFSRELTALAVPRLRAQALTSQSARIDAVSGATQTSESYRTSLQAALDTAQFRATP